MNFLNSAFLAGLAAALVPLLIHLLNRRRVKTVDFSSVMFLRDLRKTRMRRLQLRRWLLLAIRTLMVAMAVLAFARPALRGRELAGVGSRARTTVVVALDRSASMATETPNGTAYERAQRRVREIADVLGEGDQVIGLPFSAETAPPVDPPTGDYAGLVRRLAALPVGNGGTDAGAAVNAAMTALRPSQNLNREIYLITDRRRAGFLRTVVPPPPPDAAAVMIYVIDVSESGSFDLGVTSVELANQLLEPGSPFSLSATVANHTDRPVDRLLVSLFIDGRRVAQSEATVAPSGSVTVPFTATVDAPGVHSGFVEISADDNPLDNRRHFAIAIPDRIRVLLASDYPSGRTAAALALSPDPQGSKRLVIDEMDTGDMVRRNLFDYDAVIITEWRKPDRLAVDQLQRFARAGGGIFTAPSVDADTAAWNMLIAGLFGLRMGDNPLPPSSDRFFTWDRLDWNHPIWSVYRDVPREKVPEVRWYSVYRTEGEPSGQSIADFSGGRPSLSEMRLESGKWLALWSPLNSPYTDLPVRSIFVPFMNRLTEYLSTDLSERRGDFMVGEKILREPSRGIPVNAVLELVRPDGTTVRPGIERTGARVRVTYEGADQPGVYTLMAGEHPVDAFAVNVDPEEMAPELISNEELQRRWAGYQLALIGTGQSLAEAVRKTRYGTEIRPAFLWAVAALFLLEMVVARTRRRDLPQPEHVADGATSAPSHVRSSD